MTDDAKSSSKKDQYIVIQLTGGGPCKVIPEDEVFLAIYSKVYGPDKRSDCEKWVADNCRSQADTQ